MIISQPAWVYVLTIIFVLNLGIIIGFFSEIEYRKKHESDAEE